MGLWRYSALFGFIVQPFCLFIESRGGQLLVLDCLAIAFIFDFGKLFLSIGTGRDWCGFCSLFLLDYGFHGAAAECFYPDSLLFESWGQLVSVLKGV